MTKTNHETLTKLQQEAPPLVFDNREPASSVVSDRDCVCEGGRKWGHLNEAGGICCPHVSDTCGYHSDAEWW